MTAFFFNGLMYFHNLLWQNLGLAIIALTVVIKLLLAWPSAQFIRSQKKIQALQPRLQALREKHKGDREGLARATMELYRSSKVNPFSSCLPTLIQLPILIILYQVFLGGLKIDPTTHLLQSEQLRQLYPSLRAIYEQTPIETAFLPGLDLAQRGFVFGTIVLAALAAGLQYWQTRMLTVKEPPRVPGAKDESFAAATTKQMTYLAPAMTLFIVPQLPAGLGLYWVVSTLFTIGQQYLVQRAGARSDHANNHAPESS